MNWVDSKPCRHRTHCVDCRTSQKFRAFIVKNGLATDLDFTCPYGITPENAAAAKPDLINFRTPPRGQTGAGTELKKILEGFGIKTCGRCAQHAAQMDRNGIQWCKDNKPMIITWMMDEARRRGTPFIKSGAQIILNVAIRKAERSERQAEAN